MQYPVRLLCQVFDLPKSSYYDWKKARQARQPDVQRLQLVAEAKAFFKTSRESIGSRRISRHLRSQGYDIGRYAARTLMREHGLVAKAQKKHRYPKPGPISTVADNHLDRQFSPIAPNQCWVGDITYLRVLGGWVYLAVVMDLFARRIVGWAVSESPDTALCKTALLRAIETRQPPPGLLFHSDQGCQYTSLDFQSLLQSHGIVASMSRRGCCWDNAPMERLFRTLKYEWMPEHGYADKISAQLDVSQFLMDYYNQQRLHSFNDYLTPVQRELQWSQTIH